MEQVSSLQKDLPPGDKRRLTQYLDDVREVERRIQRAESRVREDLELPDVPSGVPATFQEHLKLLMDLQVIAFQADITRVSTLMLARELSRATYPETTIRDPFHNLSHHSNDRGNMDRFAQLNAYHMTKFAYFVDKLKRVAGRRRDAAGSLARPVWQFAERWQPAQFQSVADRHGWRRFRSGQGRPSPAIPEGHAHVQPAARDAGQGGRPAGSVWRQHRHADHLNDRTIVQSARVDVLAPDRTSIPPRAAPRPGVLRRATP